MTTLASDTVAALRVAGGDRRARWAKRRSGATSIPPGCVGTTTGSGFSSRETSRGAAGLDEGRRARSGQARRPFNRARAEIAEGRLADAKASLAEAERRRPGWGKTAFFRAIVSKDEGRLDDAERDLKAVLEKFPLDRVAWNNLGLVYWLAGKFPEAIAAYGKTLAIDPEDLNAHYNLMRVYRATGDRKNADLHDAAYRKYKDDETIRAIPGRLPPEEPVRQPRVASDPRPRGGRAPAGVRRRTGSPRSGRRATRPTTAT